MSLERAPVSIVRSIRHVSLVRAWAREQRGAEPPHYSTFRPDERSGEADDMIIAEVCRDGDAPTFLCRAAGKHVEQIFERPMQGREVRDSVEPRLVSASRPIWHACITQKLPIYSSFEVRDVENLPVTIEHLYLPYRQDTSDVSMVVAAFHAWSAERRFTRKGLLNDLTGVKPFPLFVVDPSIARPVEVDDEFEGL